MGRHWKLLCSATGLWAVAVTLAVGGTVRHEAFLVLWSVLVALVAWIPTGTLVVICAATAAARQERIRVERLAEIMASAAVNPGISRLPR